MRRKWAKALHKHSALHRLRFAAIHLEDPGVFDPFDAVGARVVAGAKDYHLPYLRHQRLPKRAIDEAGSRYGRCSPSGPAPIDPGDEAVSRRGGLFRDPGRKAHRRTQKHRGEFVREEPFLWWAGGFERSEHGHRLGGAACLILFHRGSIKNEASFFIIRAASSRQSRQRQRGGPGSIHRFGRQVRQWRALSDLHSDSRHRREHGEGGSLKLTNWPRRLA